MDYLISLPHRYGKSYLKVVDRKPALVAKRIASRFSTYQEACEATCALQEFKDYQLERYGYPRIEDENGNEVKL